MIYITIMTLSIEKKTLIKRFKINEFEILQLLIENKYIIKNVR